MGGKRVERETDGLDRKKAELVNVDATNYILNVTLGITRITNKRWSLTV